MKVLYCGLDIGSTKCHFVAIDKKGTFCKESKFCTKESNLRREITSLDARLKIHMEVSTLSEWVRDILLNHVSGVEQVVVSDPKTMAWIAKDALKRDSLDAWKLAEFIRIGRTHPVYYSDDRSMSDFKKTVQNYEDMSRQQTRIKNKIKSRLQAAGIIRTSTSVYTGRGRKKVLQKIDSRVQRSVVQGLFQLLDSTLQCRDEAFRLMCKQSRRWPVIKRLQEIPGIGPVLSCRFVAYIQTPFRFSNKRKLWRYCGLGITERSSDGKLLGYKKLDRNGNGSLKDLSRKAFESSMRTKKDNAFRRAYYRYLSNTGKTHARLTVQRKILTVMWTIWKEGTRYDDSRG